LALVASSAFTIALWLSHPRLKGVAACAAIGVIVVDLGIVATTSHPYGRLSDLKPVMPEVLTQDQEKPFRIYTPPIADGKTLQVEPNRLLGTGVEEAGGYSSLAPDRHSAYAAAARYTTSNLMDLWNVRYVVRRHGPLLLPSHGGTSFHPGRPLMRGQAQAGPVDFLPDGGSARVNEVRLIAALWGTRATALADGTTVARISLHRPDGATHTLDVQAGRDVADAALNVPGQTQLGWPTQPEVAFQYPRDDPRTDRFGEQLYSARLAVSPEMVVSQMTIEPLTSTGGIEVYGLGLFDAEKGEVTQVRDPAKYREVYRDDQISILRNGGAMPRAFLTDAAVSSPPGRNALSLILDGAVDVRRTTVIDDPLPAGFAHSAGTGDTPGPGRASIASYEPTQIVIRADSERTGFLVLSDIYFPGWVARIDGEPTPILRANYLFRAVAVPPGTHIVTFRYEPLSVRIGAIISAVTVSAVLIMAGAFAWAGLRRPGVR
jgi:hypothetical protein